MFDSPKLGFHHRQRRIQRNRPRLLQPRAQPKKNLHRVCHDSRLIASYRALDVYLQEFPAKICDALEAQRTIILGEHKDIRRDDVFNVLNMAI